MSAPSLQAAKPEAEREGAIRRAERETAVPVKEGGDLTALFGALQRTAGNQAVNQLLRRHAALRESRSPVAGAGIQEAVAGAVEPPLQRQPEDEDEHAAQRLAEAAPPAFTPIDQAGVGEAALPQPRAPERVASPPAASRAGEATHAAVERHVAPAPQQQASRVTSPRAATNVTVVDGAGAAEAERQDAVEEQPVDEVAALRQWMPASAAGSDEDGQAGRAALPVAVKAPRLAQGNLTTPAVVRHEETEADQAAGGTVQAAPEVGLEGGPLSAELSGRIHAQRGAGAPLDEGTRTQMEGAFGASFGAVRVHTDGEADALNRSVSAVAFTTGSDIFFRQGTYDPGSPGGRQLLAHELTHVVQQGGSAGGSGPLTVGPAGDSREQEADATGAAVARLAVDAPAALPGPPSAGASGAAARAVQRRAVADMPPVYTPVAPLDHPPFTEAMDQLKRGATSAKKHDPARRMAKTAQDAAPTPANDALSKGQAKQAQTMTGAQPGKPDKNAFLALLRQKLDAIAPKNDSDLKNFKSSGKADQMQSELKQNVQGQKDRAQGAITTATNAPPPAAPDPGPAFAQQAQATDQKMADARITTEQLQKANDPRFSAVIDARDQVHANAATAPAQFQTQQEEILSKTKGDAHGAVTAAHSHMEQAHTHAHAGAHAEQQTVMDREAQKRKEVADHIEKMFAETKVKVENKLKALDGTVDQMFTEGEKSSRDIFEAEIDRRTTEYWLDHPFSAFAGWLTESDPTKENIWHQERDNYMKRLDGTLERIADRVEQELKETKDIIAQGHAEIDKFVAGLEPALRQSGQQAEHALDSRFSELQHSIDAKREELASHLVQKYQEAQKAIDDRLKELKESEKGLLSSFEEKLAAVEKAIDEFKKRLQGVVTDAEETLDLIISDPIAFLGHLLDSLKQGFNNFLGNIVKHLEQGFIDWLTGSLSGLGIQLPTEWDLKGIILLVLQVLGVTWASIRAKIEKIIGPKAMRVIEKIVEYAQTLLQGGIEGLWEKIKEDLSGLKDMVIGAIKSWLIDTIIKQAIAKLVALSNPVGEIVEAVMDIYKTVMFFIEKAGQIMHLVETIVRSVSNIARGAIGEAANWIENAMAATIPVIIGFLADLLGLGDLPDKVMEFVGKAREVVDQAIDKALNFIVEQGKALFASLMGKDDEKDKDKADERTDEQKDADIASAYAKVEPLVQDESKSAADVKRELPAIQSEFKLSSLDMAEVPQGESKETVTVTAIIQRAGPVTGVKTKGAELVEVQCNLGLKAGALDVKPKLEDISRPDLDALQGLFGVGSKAELTNIELIGHILQYEVDVILGEPIARGGAEDAFALGSQIGLLEPVSGKDGKVKNVPWQRAHVIGPGFGIELPMILYAPAKVNQDLQNRGIEKLLRELAAKVGEFGDIHVTAIVTSQPGSLRLGEITYKVEGQQEGQPMRSLLEVTIVVEGAVEAPRVTSKADYVSGALEGFLGQTWQSFVASQDPDVEKAIKDENKKMPSVLKEHAKQAGWPG